MAGWPGLCNISGSGLVFLIYEDVPAEGRDSMAAPSAKASAWRSGRRRGRKPLHGCAAGQARQVLDALPIKIQQMLS
jgi:hypothetical protein